ncbi:MAG: hypothetical protein QXR19_02560 [Candidatus Jordarchaeaceae archaeon]
MSVHRPGGVIALSVIFLIIAGLGVAGVITIWAMVLPNSYQSLNWYILESFYILELGINPIAALGGISNPLFTIPQNIRYAYIFGGVLAIFSALYLIVGVGLLSMRNWARVLGLILGIISIIVGVLLFLIIFLYGFLFGTVFLVLGIVTVAYLAGDVKYEFQ